MSVEAVRGVIDNIGALGAPASGARPSTGFGDLLNRMVANADSAQKESDALVESLARGEPTDVHQVVLALSQADVTFRTLLEVRNRLVEAYQEIQRMPV
jgi:flagellar hook-basal body complex protein FliE